MLLRVEFKMVSAPGLDDVMGRTITDFYVRSGTGVVRLAALMKALGLAACGKVSIDPDSFVGKVIVADIIHETYKGKVKAGLTNLRPVPPAPLPLDDDLPEPPPATPGPLL